MATDPNIKYPSNSLDYAPTIKDTWKAENEIGNSEGVAPIVEIIEGNPVIETNPFLSTDAMNLIMLNNSTTSNTSDSISAVVTALQNVSIKFESTDFDYPNTSYMTDHAISFWTSISDLVNFFSLTLEDIEDYKAILALEETTNQELGEISSKLQLGTTTTGIEVSELMQKYDDKKEELKVILVSKDVKRTQCFMASDVNRSVMTYSDDCSKLCQTMVSTPDNEQTAIKGAAADTFLGLSKEDVQGISDVMSGELLPEIVSLKRVADSGTDQYSVNSHIYEMQKIADYKMNIVPKVKHIMRNNNSNCDFTNLVINDMLDKCTTVDEKYDNLLVNTVKYMHAENSILLKTFVNETKLNRFQKAPDYINT